MKRNLFLGIGLILFSCNDTTSTNNKPTFTSSAVAVCAPGTGKEGDNSLLEEIKLNEPTAKDVMITDKQVLFISVIDDGTPRDGISEYYCQLAKNYRSSVKRIRILRYDPIRKMIPASLLPNLPVCK